MRLNDFIHSTHMRFAGLIGATVFISYVLAGLFALQSVGKDLEERVVKSARLSFFELEEIYRVSGVDAFVNAVNARAETAHPDDEIYWLGDSRSNYLAGQSLVSPEHLQRGNYLGAQIGRDAPDEYFLNVDEVGGLILITGASYEESHDIKERIFSIFFAATFLSFLLVTLSAFVFAIRGKRRVDAIDLTLQRVSNGDLDARVPTSSSKDDISHLAKRINLALGQLSSTVAGIRQVSVDVAHDLRTPLNRLGLRLESLRSDETLSAEQETSVDAILEESRGIVRSFDAILRISQIESGARRERFKAVSAQKVVNRLFEALEAVVEDAGLSLQINTHDVEQGQLVFGDEDLLLQLFANLIENAVRYAGDNAQIEIGLASTKSSVEIHVQDNGLGIPESERIKVLDRWYRVDKSRNAKGSGLGLSLVNAISKLHYAELILEDAEPGLRVVVRFPHFYDGIRIKGNLK